MSFRNWLSGWSISSFANKLLYGAGLLSTVFAQNSTEAAIERGNFVYEGFKAKNDFGGFNQYALMCANEALLNNMTSFIEASCDFIRDSLIDGLNTLGNAAVFGQGDFSKDYCVLTFDSAINVNGHGDAGALNGVPLSHACITAVLKARQAIDFDANIRENASWASIGLVIGGGIGTFVCCTGLIIILCDLARNGNSRRVAVRDPEIGNEGRDAEKRRALDYDSEDSPEEKEALLKNEGNESDRFLDSDDQGSSPNLKKRF